MLIPRRQVPSLRLQAARGGYWNLARTTPKSFDLLVFYRGVHCPMCISYLQDLEIHHASFAKLGVDCTAISMDDATRADAMVCQTGSTNVLYGLTTPQARKWGLFLSKAIREGEPALFNEPGLALVRPDKTLFYCCINSAPWGRPMLSDILAGVRSALKRGSQARGEA